MVAWRLTVVSATISLAYQVVSLLVQEPRMSMLNLSPSAGCSWPIHRSLWPVLNENWWGSVGNEKSHGTVTCTFSTRSRFVHTSYQYLKRIQKLPFFPEWDQKPGVGRSSALLHDLLIKVMTGRWRCFLTGRWSWLGCSPSRGWCLRTTTCSRWSASSGRAAGPTPCGPWQSLRDSSAN